MPEITCPRCKAPTNSVATSQMLMCPFCSATFSLDWESGEKEIFQDHFIVPNAISAAQSKEMAIEWAKRVHHDPKKVEKEFIVSDISGCSIPFWVVSLEVNTNWKGFVKKERTKVHEISKSDYVVENGYLRRNYRWSICAQKNFCDFWGLDLLHEPREPIMVEWDGFPLDTTFSRGRIDGNTGIKTLDEGQQDELSAYDNKENFDFKYSNGHDILPIEVKESEAVRRAVFHTKLYHFKLAKSNVHIIVDSHSEHETSGVELIHLPFWYVKYVYRPSSFLRYFYKDTPKNILLEGYTGGVLKSELSIRKKDKIMINATICLAIAVVLALLSVLWSPVLWFFVGFFIFIAVVSLVLSSFEKINNVADRENKVFLSKEGISS